MKNKKLWLTVLFGFTAASSIIVGALSFTAYAYTNEVLPRVYLAGESIGNLNFPEASQRIESKVSELQNSKLLISLDDKQANLAVNELGVTIDKSNIEKQLLVVNDPWSWTRLGFWKRFLQKTNVEVTYRFDSTTVQQKIEQALQISSTARNAKVGYSNGGLIVESGQNGQSINLDTVHQILNNYFSSGVTEPIKLTFVETAPIINNEAANSAKLSVESTLTKPIKLQFENQSFTVPVANQYSFVNFTPDDTKLIWSIDNAKVQDYLYQIVSRKLNIKMRQRVILQDTGEVTDQGQDGREVQLASLTSSVVSAIRDQQDTINSPITVPARTIALTEQVITPGYIAGLFEGLYLDINLSKQRVYVMNGTQKQTEWLISSGKRGTPTPVGLFYIKNKIALAQSSLYPGLWMQNWNALSRNSDGSGYEGYGLHKVPCFNSSCTLRESLSHLGKPASHGCVRIEDVGAEWVFANVPVGTPVNIHS